MDSFEAKLKRAMQGQDPPEGFAERVMARVTAEPAGSERAAGVPAPKTGWLERHWPRRGGAAAPRWRMALATGLAMIVLASAGLEYRHHAEQQRLERLRGEQARAELMLALQITGDQLHRVREVLVQQQRGDQEQSQ